jgi:hypothetical protein
VTNVPGLLERAVVRGAHASEGDHRGWGEIHRWAEAIAAQLKAEQTTRQSKGRV